MLDNKRTIEILMEDWFVSKEEARDMVEEEAKEYIVELRGYIKKLEDENKTLISQIETQNNPKLIGEHSGDWS